MDNFHTDVPKLTVIDYQTTLNNLCNNTPISRTRSYLVNTCNIINDFTTELRSYYSAVIVCHNNYIGSTHFCHAQIYCASSTDIPLLYLAFSYSDRAFNFSKVTVS